VADGFYRLNPEDAERAYLWGQEEPPEPSGTERDLIDLADVAPKPVDWIIPGLVQAGELNLLAGEGGLGKGLLQMAWAVQLAQRGERSIIVSAEDDPTYATSPRRLAHGVDVRGILQARVLPVFGNGDEGEWIMRLHQWVVDEEARLLCFDPFNAFLDTHTDSYKDQHVRRVLVPLRQLAMATGCGVLVVKHLNKDPSTDPRRRVGDSPAWINTPRQSMILVPKDGDYRSPMRVLAHFKTNSAMLATPQLWEVEPIVLPRLYDGRAIDTARLVFRGLEERALDDLLRPSEPAEERGDFDTACELIESWLTDDMPSRELTEGLREFGISPRTAERARKFLGVQVVKRGKSWVCLALSQSKTAKKNTANHAGGVPVPLNHAGLRPTFDGSPPSGGDGGVPPISHPRSVTNSDDLHSIGTASYEELRERFRDDLDA
jgi:hypothetical protein